jgi:hypothetical protein
VSNRWGIGNEIHVTVFNIEKPGREVQQGERNEIRVEFSMPTPEGKI